MASIRERLATLESLVAAHDASILTSANAEQVADKLGALNDRVANVEQAIGTDPAAPADAQADPVAEPQA